MIFFYYVRIPKFLFFFFFFWGGGGGRVSECFTINQNLKKKFGGGGRGLE